ncbi:MAG: GNAT family N-acetyltransferase [Elusimicrobiaceae bacterium]|nr:GNAT family N-acetyltransferase [Elusimicrobiaceae bacterium]
MLKQTVNAAEFAATAEGTGVFARHEIDVLKEILRDCEHDPANTYVIDAERDGSALRGFSIYGRTPMTDFGWDVYWIVVAKNQQGRGLGKQLLDRAEQAIMAHDKRAVLRIETSSLPEYAPARKLYLKCGYEKTGTIPDFYKAGDSLMLFHKLISR